jgi:hypothetical protein
MTNGAHLGVLGGQHVAAIVYLVSIAVGEQSVVLLP